MHKGNAVDACQAHLFGPNNLSSLALKSKVIYFAENRTMEIYPGAASPLLCNSTYPYLCNESKPLGLEDKSEHQQYIIGLFLSCLYTIFLFPIGFVGNILILVVNISFREKMTIPDLYFINLAVADLILVADSLIEVFNLDEKYYDITIICTFMSLFLQINMYSSIFFLTWMSFDRYIALAKVMRSNIFRTMEHARLSCGLIWLASISAALVPFTAVHLQHTGEIHFCFADVKEIQWLEITLGFIIPFAIIGLCYSLIVRVLIRAHKHRSLRLRRQKALRMIFVVVLVFFICWLPENVFISVQLLQKSEPVPSRSQSFRHSHPLTGHIVNLAAFSNSCLNPLIYSFLGETFRDKLRLYIEQKAKVSALHRFCQATLKSVIPDSTEQSEV
ncbi:UNVERIFIED_CONTAM: G-protein coupled estrogen receptor 1 [Gekko kuhli]